MKLYDTRNLKGDLSGGMVAGIIALPLALAFGVQSGLGAAAGLYGAIAVGVLAAALGGTATQASGPTGPMTVVSASIVAMGIARAGTIEAGMGVVLLAFMLGGLIQIALGFLDRPPGRRRNSRSTRSPWIRSTSWFSLRTTRCV